LAPRYATRRSDFFMDVLSLLAPASIEQHQLYNRVF
jgi:hypothetical protein